MHTYARFVQTSTNLPVRESSLQKAAGVLAQWWNNHPAEILKLNCLQIGKENWCTVLEHLEDLGYTLVELEEGWAWAEGLMAGCLLNFEAPYYNKESSKENTDYNKAHGDERYGKLVGELLQQLGIDPGDLPVWLVNLLHEVGMFQAYESLQAALEYREKKKCLTSVEGTVRAALKGGWRTRSKPIAAGQIEFKTWFEQERRRGKVLASTLTKEGLLVYGSDGEPIGYWPDVMKYV